MDLKELLGYQPVRFEYVKDIKAILESGQFSPAFVITTAISYGIILEKRMERAKRKPLPRKDV